MKKLFNVCFIVLALSFFSLSPKSFADTTNLTAKHANLANGSLGVDDYISFGEGTHKKVPCTPEPQNALLFLAGTAVLAAVVLSKKLKLT